MVVITQERRIAAAPEQVWSVVADFPNIYRWAPIVNTSRQLGALARGVGAARACEIPGFGAITETVDHWIEGRELSFTFEASGGPVKEGRSHWTVSGEGPGTLVRVRAEFSTRYGLIGAIVGHTIVRLMMGRMAGDLLAGLDHHVRTGEIVDRTVARRLGLRAA
jgi:carbon monoxide dehydrogenase subunit G